jgi:AAA domain
MEVISPTDRRFCKALIFAPAGAGKTVLLGTAQQDERTFPMLLLDFEGGTESLAGLDIDTVPIRSWDDYNEVYEALANGDTLEFEDDGDGYTIDFSAYNSLGIDSISETHKFALLEILRKEGASRRDPDLVEQGDYGRATTQMRRLLREFRDLDMHVFFAAHAKETDVPREGRVRLPDLAGQLAEEVSGLMSIAGYLAQFEDDDGNPHRTLLLHSFPKFRIKARTRWGVSAPAEIIDPTITKLLDALGYGDTAFEQTGSSKGKQVDDDVPEDEPGRLPGRDAQTGDVSGEDAESDESPGDDDSEPENASDVDLGAMTLREMKTYATEAGIDLNGARTRSAARQIIEEALMEQK